MRDLIIVRKAPKTAVAPKFIDTKNLFNLNVDDLIWQDIGLDKDEGAPPPWLKDEDIRKGIKAMLEIDRCDEENDWLIVEMQSLQEWFAEEWMVLMKTLDIIDVWGPSEEELNEAQTWEVSGSLDVLEEGDYDTEFEAEVDPVLTEQEETVAFADVYRSATDEDLYL
ncbi:hypothetical protein VKT23_016225 [Stygiomarasmius scandens]|uniref:Uncharacterized protein n=1 Tax=Marasmiellus scandens TaxID=2682957 RepID=A0ABR1IYF3_9AGAR